MSNSEMQQLDLDIFFTKKLPVKEGKCPRVVRLKRSKDRLVQGCTIYIGRKVDRGGWNLPASKWANPFSVQQCGSVEKAVASYREYILKRTDLLTDLHELENAVLGCWYALRHRITRACHFPYFFPPFFATR
tara:strand:- start:4 stop:399 length:396 start_codon:yes stop_codon:yes gene_type:complete